MDFKVITEKDGMKFVRTEKNHYMLSFSIQNQHIHLPSIVNFDLVKLIYDLNGDIYEKVHLEKINEDEAVITLVMKHFFADMGLPQRYSYLHTRKQSDGAFIIFDSQSIYSEKPDKDMVPEEAVLVPMESIKMVCELVTESKMNLNCSVRFHEKHNVPAFMEKFVGMIVHKIFNRLKQFIENYRI